MPIASFLILFALHSEIRPAIYNTFQSCDFMFMPFCHFHIFLFYALVHVDISPYIFFLLFLYYFNMFIVIHTILDLKWLSEVEVSTILYVYAYLPCCCQEGRHTHWVTLTFDLAFR